MSEARPEFRCSDDARARGDRFVGTAPPAKHWFLVEQAGGWGPNAWAGLDLADRDKGELEGTLEDAGARLMLIRRPASEGRTSTPAGDGTGRRWCVIQSLEGAERRVVWGSAADADGLLAAARLFSDPGADVPGRDHTPTGGAREAGVPEGDEPDILLVCTHGRKDVCCAVRGRPLAARAAELWPEATWECTHTGGDRFAGNLVVLPDGACYGGLDPEDVEAIVRAHVAGRVDPTQLRGPTGFSNQVQAAMVAAYGHFAPLAFDAVQPVASTGSAEAWQVRLEVRGVGTVEVTGHTETTPAEFLTCKADVRKVMRLPMVDSLEVIQRG
ncbi:MAG TPA: sucrase ferredoxin [Propionibacterium sp.]|jgi:(2Fe-2S) ferredoxin|nr:sucrase ferredoxin [Propionibacterium sp.]